MNRTTITLTDEQAASVDFLTGMGVTMLAVLSREMFNGTNAETSGQRTITLMAITKEQATKIHAVMQGLPKRTRADKVEAITNEAAQCTQE